jgi:hypothetical protein
MSRGKLSRESIAAAAQKWANGYAGSGAAMAKGVQNPTRDPTAAAIAQQNAMVQGWNASITSGQWKASLASAGLAGWQAGMMQKTIPSLATRANVGQPHVTAFLNAWAPAITAAIQSLPPRGDYAANKARSGAMQDWEHAQRGKFRKMWRGQAFGG